jgi:transaldolase
MTIMTSKLDQLRHMSTVVADTGDIEAVTRLKPVDCTTNPSIVLKALGTPMFADVVKEAVAWGKQQGGNPDAVSAAVADRLAISVGAALVRLVPGRVSTEVDANLSFDTEASINQAHAIIAAYKERGVERDRILIKLASTWEGIHAAEVLQRQGIDCNLTLLFSKVQAIACADAKVFLISPFVGRILDWYKKSTGKDYAPEEDPGVISVRDIYNYYKVNNIKTIVMGASFRSAAEIEALAGCDRLTIAPALLDELSNDQGRLERRLSPDAVKPAPRLNVDEKTFRWMLNEDPMASEKLAEGIRSFAKDLGALRAMVRKELQLAAA